MTARDDSAPLPSTARGSVPAGPELTIRANTGRLAGWSLVVVAAGIVLASLLHGGPVEALHALPLAALLAGLAWTVFLSQRLELRPSGLELVRSFTRTGLEWAGLKEAEADWGLRLHATLGDSVVWRALAGGRPNLESEYADVIGDRIGSDSGSRRERSTHRRAVAARGSARTGGSLGQRRRERDRSAGMAPLTRWTDPSSRARETVTMSAREAALVVTAYADQRRALPEAPSAQRHDGPAGADSPQAGVVHRAVRWDGVLAVLVPLAAMVLLSLGG